MLSVFSSNAVFSLVSSPFTPGANPQVRSRTFGLGIKAITLLIATLSLTGCGSITGLDAGETFSCDVPNGVPCQSLQKAYQQTLIEESNAQLVKLNSRSTAVMVPLDADGKSHASSSNELQRANVSLTPVTDRDVMDPRLRFVSSTGDEVLSLPKRVPESVLTLFVAPWTDQDGDLHEGETVYVTVRASRWAEGGRRAALASSPTWTTVADVTPAASPAGYATGAQPHTHGLYTSYEQSARQPTEAERLARRREAKAQRWRQETNAQTVASYVETQPQTANVSTTRHTASFSLIGANDKDSANAQNLPAYLFEGAKTLSREATNVYRHTLTTSQNNPYVSSFHPLTNEEQSAGDVARPQSNLLDSQGDAVSTQAGALEHENRSSEKSAPQEVTP